MLLGVNLAPSQGSYFPTAHVGFMAILSAWRMSGERDDRAAGMSFVFSSGEYTLATVVEPRSLEGLLLAQLRPDEVPAFGEESQQEADFLVDRLWRGLLF